MADGVFNNRLQQEARHHSFERFRGYINPDSKTIGKPDLLNRQITFYDLQFL